MNEVHKITVLIRHLIRNFKLPFKVVIVPLDRLKVIVVIIKFAFVSNGGDHELDLSRTKPHAAHSALNIYSKQHHIAYLICNCKAANASRKYQSLLLIHKDLAVLSRDVIQLQYLGSICQRPIQYLHLHFWQRKCFLKYFLVCFRKIKMAGELGARTNFSLVV